MTEFTPSNFTDTFTKTPRYYQIDAADEVARYLENGVRRIEVIGPTGCGKTMTSKLVATSKRVREAIGCSEVEVLRVLFISNRHRLNRQAVEEFSECQSVQIIPHSAFCSIPDSLIEAGWDLTIIDECHHEAMSSIQMLLDKLVTKPIIGFTADNKRGDGLLCKFERCVIMISEREAAEKGFIEKAGINTILDYSGNDKTDYALDIVRQYGHCMGNSIAFFRTTEEVRAFHQGLLEMGYTSGYLDNHSTEADLDRCLDDLSSGKIQFLSNCSKVGEGIDTPNVTDVLLFRSFNSRAEKKQYIGRAIRSDSPCAVWELMNPLVETVPAHACVGGVKYQRLIYKFQGQWNEKLNDGEDLTWGRMASLRKQPVAPKPAKEASAEVEFESHAGSALSLVEMGINTNTYSDRQQIERVGGQSLSEWLNQQRQLSLFNDLPEVETETKIRVKAPRRRAA